ncbi:MAG: glycosyltransferase family 39 protein [Patescibacteria group bacterium]|nr:glycosyltransferase family 39 protein [Patescibacteria group bacterium]
MSESKSNHFLKKEIGLYDLNIKVYQILILFCLLLGCFLVRFYRLTSLPVFADEAIYVRWSQVMRSEAGLRFLPLQDGKQPFFMWLTIPFLKIFPKDPLLAGRMVSVFSGLATLAAIFFLPFVLSWPFRVSLLAGLIYIFVPFAVFFDRMALADSLLSAFGIWSLVFSLLIARYRRLDLSMILGFILGGALLTKSPAVFSLILSPVLIVFAFVLIYKQSLKKVFQLIPLILTSLFIALAIYNILRLGESFHMIAIRNKDYLWPVKEIIKHPLDPLVPHLKDVFRYYWSYFTLPLLVLPFFIFLKKLDFKLLFLFFWWLIPLAAQSAMAKVFTARYILSGVPVWVLFSGLGLFYFWEKLNLRSYFCLFSILVVLLIPSFYFSYFLFFNPAKAPLPKDERMGYLEEWTAGWGIRETAEFLKSQQIDNHIVIGTEGYFGTLPDGLQIYLEKEEGITAIGVGYPIKSLPEPLSNAAEFGNRVYLVVNRSRFVPEPGFEPELIKEYPKPGGDSLLFLKIN